MSTETVGIADSTPRAGVPEGRTRAASRTTPTPMSGGVRRAQAAAVLSLVALPLFVYGLPAVLGHPVVPGDDLTQNLPLRELVGRDLRSGNLPIFDQYIWSGAPLLAGWNGGAAYPLTWLFAALPGVAAWTVNLVAAGVTAGVTCYAFLRASRLGVLASWAGGITYAFGGGMVAQVPHVSLVIGMSWVPLALLAVLRLTDSGTAGQGLLWWTAALAGAVALVIFAGEPRAVTDAAAILVLYGAWRLARLARLARRASSARQARGTAPDGASSSPAVRAAWWKASVATASGVVLGVGMGAVQLLPGLAAVATSQRAQVSAYLFGAGSLPVHWLTLLGVPDLLGGSGSFGQPAFFANYNLTEVTGYVGLIPLVGAVALLARARRRGSPREWVVWEVIAVVGILLALGNNTPLWHALIHIPLIGGQRLQSRGILVTDLALAVLLAYWLDGWAASSNCLKPPARGARRGPGDLAERVLGALPMLGVVALVALGLADGRSLLGWMGVAKRAGVRAAALAPWLVPSLLLALGGLALVALGPRLLPPLRAALAATFIVVDLLVFAVTTVVAIGTPAGGAGTTVTAVVPNEASRLAAAAPTSGIRPIKTLRLSGRFAVYDPGLLYPSQLATLGVPDTNTIEGTWSVQGYGSIVDGHYAAATGVHAVSGTGQDVFSPHAAMDGVLDSLSTGAVLAPSQYLMTTFHRGAAVPATGPGTRPVTTATGATWFLGVPLPVRSARLEVHVTSAAEAGGAAGMRVGLLTRDGTVDWGQLHAPRAVEEPAGLASSSLSSRWTVLWHSRIAAVGLVVDSEARAVVSPPVVRSWSGKSFVLDGALQNAIVAPHWRYGDQDGSFAVFFNRRARAPLSLRALPGTSLRGAAVRGLSGPFLDPGSAYVESPHGVEVVRADAAVPGWTASWTPSIGASAARATMPLAVDRLGIVQVVRVPAGRGVLTWRYVAPGLLIGELVSAVALALVVGLLLVLTVAFTTNRRGLRPRRSP